jgi:hypothetical protein
MAKARKVPRPFTMHWGGGVISEEASVTTEWSEPTIQLMDYTDGEAAGGWSVRFCSFSHGGQFQRSPLMIDRESIEALREALNQTPRLREILKRLLEDQT